MGKLKDDGAEFERRRERLRPPVEKVQDDGAKIRDDGAKSKVDSRGMLRYFAK